MVQKAAGKTMLSFVMRRFRERIHTVAAHGKKLAVGIDDIECTSIETKTE